MNMIPTISMILLLSAFGFIIVALLVAIVAEQVKSDTAENIARWLLFAALVVVLLAFFLVVVYLPFGRPV